MSGKGVGWVGHEHKGEGREELHEDGVRAAAAGHLHPISIVHGFEKRKNIFIAKHIYHMLAQLSNGTLIFCP
jgi:hypothetical protein